MGTTSSSRRRLENEPPRNSTTRATNATASSPIPATTATTFARTRDVSAQAPRQHQQHQQLLHSSSLSDRPPLARWNSDSGRNLFAWDQSPLNHTPTDDAMEDLDDNNNDDNDDATNVAYHHNREYHQTYNDDDNDYSDDDLQDEDYEEDHTNYSASYYDDNHTHNAHNVEEERIASRSTWRSTRNNETNGTISNTATTNRKHTIRKGYQKYPKQTLPHNTHKKEEDVVDDFLPCASLDFEWMGRSLETLVFGHTSPCPILAKQRTESFTPCSKKEKGETNRHQHASSAAQPTRTTANARNGSWRGRSRINHRGYPNRTGPNIAMSLLAREFTGKPTSKRAVPCADRLTDMGGKSLYAALDKPSGGMPSEVALLKEAIDRGYWTETQTIVSKLALRLIGDPSLTAQQQPHRQDPSLPRSASPYYAGGGRLGFEREAFVLSGGVELFIRIFREEAFVSSQLGQSNDARDLPEEMVASKLTGCWNEIFASLRELAYVLPELVENGTLLDNGDFLPFLFTLLAHDSCFDGAAALIEEILSTQSQTPPPQAPPSPAGEGNGSNAAAAAAAFPKPPTPTVMGHMAPVTTFYLGNVPNLYELWGNFNCRQLAHFCRILALVVFEPEDRELLESPAVLKSMELLQLRRDRAARAGRDAAVDMNQAILLGDATLLRKLLQLLRVLNFAPNLKRGSAYHVMAHFPWIADTLVMLGLSELEDWNEIDRLDNLARQMLHTNDANKNDSSEMNTPSHEEAEERQDDDEFEAPAKTVSDLGSIVDMLESLSGLLFGNAMEPTTQLGHIMNVINAAQQAGVVVGRQNRRRTRRRNEIEERRSSRGGNYSNQSEDANANTNDRSSGRSTLSGTDTAVLSNNVTAVQIDSISMEDLASGAGTLSDQVLFRNVYSTSVEGNNLRDNDTTNARIIGVGVDDGPGGEPTLHHLYTEGRGRVCINTPEDAANELQFNSLLLAPYQVEVLFVICTLLGGRRKIDTQRKLKEYGIIPILNEMFHRLSWGTSASIRQSRSPFSNDTSSTDGRQHESEIQPSGIHGPGCECNPESALRVQYLRLLHNFCDRDCDNYSARRLLLSRSEREHVFSVQNHHEPGNMKLKTEPGLLSKILKVFINEPDDSPYRFWLASCAESYLRGSSPQEQLFAAQSGLLDHLVKDVISDRLHCAGSLQTAFDLLGELCKGNVDVLQLLLGDLNEESFRRFMSVAAANLVDSNVFIRSLLLSIERIAATRQCKQLHFRSTNFGTRKSHGAFQTADDPNDDQLLSRWTSERGSSSYSYLTQSWWDTTLDGLPPKCNSSDSSPRNKGDLEMSFNERQCDESRPSDWFPARPHGDYTDKLNDNTAEEVSDQEVFQGATYLDENVGHCGWVFSPASLSDENRNIEWELNPTVYEPNSIERLSWFLSVNQARLLKDLLGVFDLRSINHENICCLNTAVVVAIFAYRRQELPHLLKDLRFMTRKERVRSGNNTGRGTPVDDAVDQMFIETITDMRLDDIAGVENERSYDPSHQRQAPSTFGDRSDVLKNFRELLWFWSEYYTHRGRDRLSLEFSSHLRFQEWKNVVKLLSGDDGSTTSLVRNPVRVPKSPYRRAPRIR